MITAYTAVDPNHTGRCRYVITYVNEVGEQVGTTKLFDGADNHFEDLAFVVRSCGKHDLEETVLVDEASLYRAWKVHNPMFEERMQMAG